MLMAVDPTLFHLLNAGADSPLWYIQMARLVSNWLPAVSGTVLLLWLWQQGPAGRRNLLYVAVSLALAWVAGKLIRWGFPTPRPAHYGMGTQWIAHAANASMPSMHALGAFVVAQAMQLCLARRTRWLPPLLWLSAALVALSRVVLGVHFPSDIAAGALLGCGCAWAIWQARLWWERRSQNLQVLQAPHFTL